MQKLLKVLYTLSFLFLLFITVSSWLSAYKNPTNYGWGFALINLVLGTVFVLQVIFYFLILFRSKWVDEHYSFKIFSWFFLVLPYAVYFLFND
ncbi:MAG TPA: hypothetical protein VIH52_02930 [Candidatus Nanoarchaeia archaeon]|nr:hypothetical protein [uncultured archaeon]